MNKIVGRAGWRKSLYTVGILLGLALLAQQAWQGMIALRQAQACVARPLYSAGVLASYVAAYGVQMAAWALIMRSLHAPLPAKAVLEGYALAFLPRYIPGSIWGYLSRNEWLAQNHGVSYGVSTTASLIEAAMLLVTAALLGGVYALPTLLPLPLPTNALLALGSGALIIGTAAIWYLLPRLMARFTKSKETTEAYAGRRSNALWLLVATTLLYLCFWGLQGIALVAIAQTLCGGMALPLAAATSAGSLAWAIGFLIIFVPAGLGVREWSLGTLLVYFAALSPGQATLLAVVSRMGMIAAEVLALLVGLQSQIIKRQIKRRKNARWANESASALDEQ